MTWVRQAPAVEHVCAFPFREETYELPGNLVQGGQPARWTASVIDGRQGDLWRCDGCRALWRMGDACDACDYYGHGAHGGQHAVGMKWRSATFWQRWRSR